MAGHIPSPSASTLSLVTACLVAAFLSLGVAAAGAQVTGGDHEPNADAVVLSDGLRIETRSGFRIEGKRVVFTDRHGKLRSVAVRDVDLDASRRSAEPPDTPPMASNTTSTKPEPVLVLDNDDFPHVEEAERQRALADEAERRRVHDRAAARSRVRQGTGGGQESRPRYPPTRVDGLATGLAAIGHWSSAPSRQTSGTEVVGRVVNPTDQNLDRVGVKIKIFDEDGKLVKSGSARLDRTRLAPRTSTNFRYVDPSLASLKGLTVDFHVTARALSWGARPVMSGGR